MNKKNDTDQYFRRYQGSALIDKLDYIYVDALEEVKPEAVTIII